MNDSVIADAVKKLPPKIYAMNASVIASKLKGRRDLLYKKGMKYYRFLSKEVNVVGSNKNEFFRVSNLPEGIRSKSI